MNNIRVALLQIMPTGTLEGNMREYRRNEVHGNAYRRPDMYGLLLSEEIKEPFIRQDRRN